LGRTLSKGAQGEVLDRLKVFNSVEVLAPAIDDLRKSEKSQLSASGELWGFGVDRNVHSDSTSSILLCVKLYINILLCTVALFFVCPSTLPFLYVEIYLFVTSVWGLVMVILKSNLSKAVTRGNRLERLPVGTIIKRKVNGAPLRV
jgi:hypothetical protein